MSRPFVDPSSDRELDAAIIAYLVGDITDDALAALDHRLRVDRVAARRFAELSTREVLLGGALRMREGHPDHHSSRLRLLPPPRRSSPGRWITAAVAILLVSTAATIAITHYAANDRHDHAPAIARVFELTGTAQAMRGGHAVAIVVQASLNEHDRIIVAPGSRLGLAYRDGTRFTLDADTVLSLSAAVGGRLDLERGSFSAAVAHHDPRAPLVVVTPQARIEVLGTQLRLAIADAATRLEVSEGRVRMTRAADNSSVDVEAGYSATAAASVIAFQPLTTERIDSPANAFPPSTAVYFRTAFSDHPEDWPGALASPIGAPPGTMAIRTMHVKGPQRDYLDIRVPRTAMTPSAWLPAGTATSLRFRYLAERISTGDFIDVRLVDTKSRIFHRRIRPQLDGLASASAVLDGSFTSLEAVAPEQPMPSSTEIVAVTFRLVAWDGSLAPATSQLWLEEVVAYANGAASSAVAPAVGDDAHEPSYRHSWDFDTGAPPEFTLLNGSTWHYLPTGGVGGSGCMETDGDYFAATIDIPRPTFPVRITFERNMQLPAIADGYSVFVAWDRLRSLAYAHRPTTTIDLPLDNDQPRFDEVVNYLTDSYLEARLCGQRAAVSFGERAPDARMLLLVIGRNRIDNLRIESVDAPRMPSVEALRAAIAALPERTSGSVVVMPPDSEDPQHPYSVEFRQLTPGTSPWIKPNP